MQGVEMTEMAELKAVGAVAVTDDGKDIQSSWVMRRVLEYAEMCGLVYMAHCEDHTLMEGGAMNEGFNATRLGIPACPKAMEEIMIERNARLAELAGARIHTRAGALIELTEQHVAAFALHHTEDTRAGLTRTEHRVGFPMTEFRARLHDRGALADPPLAG